MSAGNIYSIGWTATFTKGTALRAGNVPVPYLQLSSGGPKFATYNVGATAEGEYGVYFTKDQIASAIGTWGSDYWEAPDENDLNALKQLFASFSTEKKWGTFQGAYTENVLTLPAAGYKSGGTTLNANTEGNYWNDTGLKCLSFTSSTSPGEATVSNVSESFAMSLRLILKE